MLDNFREWLSDNLRYILLGLAVLLVIIVGVCIVRLIGGSTRKSSSSNTSSVSTSTQTASNTAQQDEETTEGQAAAAATTSSAPEVATADLTRDDAAILELVTKYFTAVAAKDTATLETIVNPWNDEVEASILSNDVIASYENIHTYSKAGPVDNSYVVYAYYEGKVDGISTAVPSLSMLYVITDDSGNLVVSDRNSSQEVADYINSVTSDSDVQALIADVNEACEAAKDSDPDLKAFIDGTSSGEESTEADSSSASSGTATALSGVNVRSEGSTNGSILGVLYQGQEVNVVQKGDEWTQISYSDSSSGSTITGYVATEYLDFGEESAGTSADSTSEDTASADSSASEATAAANATATANTSV